jgi:hypothetical protein
VQAWSEQQLDASADATDAPPCWEDHLCTLLSDQICPHLSEPTKRSLRLVSKSVREAFDRSVEHLTLTSPKDVKGLSRLTCCWQPKHLKIRTQALSAPAWQELLGQPVPCSLVHTRLNSLTIHAPYMFLQLLQVRLTGRGHVCCMAGKMQACFSGFCLPRITCALHHNRCCVASSC